MFALIRLRLRDRPGDGNARAELIAHLIFEDGGDAADERFPEELEDVSPRQVAAKVDDLDVSEQGCDAAIELAFGGFEIDDQIGPADGAHRRHR